MKKYFNLPILIFILTVLYFFQPVLIHNKLPIPADTIVGLYHPFRDVYVKDFPNGIPYKNSLITDPVRQQYPWRFIAIDDEKQGMLPLWNPYSMAGTPLIGNLQSAALYPLNVVLFVLPFSAGWSFLILLQPLLAGLFLYLYLRNLRLNPFACLLGSITFAFCGFSTAWLEWGTVGHVALWLPLLLLSIDKLFVEKKNRFIWSIIFLFTLVSSFLGGHVQTFFYISLVCLSYFFGRWFMFGKSIKMLLLFFSLIGFFLILTFVQWYPLLQLILQSARDIDQKNWQQIEGWFIPWPHLIQFIAPDFFGNPTTLNYWGTWNYGELVGYVGIAPLLFSLFAMGYRRDRKTVFFGLLFLLSLLFSLPTIFAQVPFLLHIPFLNTSQPTRLLFITDFSLAVLAALGCDWFIKQKEKKQIVIPLCIMGIIFGCLWIFVLLGHKLLPGFTPEHIATAKRNIIFPTVFFLSLSMVIICSLFSKNKKIQRSLLSILILITIVDLTRFSQKFIPFTDKNYLYPQTQILSLLQNDHSQFRIMSTDSRILPPNFSLMYRLQTVDGYDPLYIRRYGELIAASERGKPDISAPFGFNRILTPHTADSSIIDLLGVKYILSLSDLPKGKFTKITQEGETKLYRNNQAFPRAFFVQEVKGVNDKQQAISFVFKKENDLHKVAVVEGWNNSSSKFTSGTVAMRSYKDNEIVLDTTTEQAGFLVLTDTNYPTWKVKVCNDSLSQCTPRKIFQTDYNFRGIVVPPGKHTVVFYTSLL